ncbi:MAG: ACT domain-containing protein [Blautia sp.]|nr:ACT domain-containing protein [Blautia sp.]
MQKSESEKMKYFVVRERAVPDVLLKVVEAKKLLDSGKAATIQEAADRTGISRSSYYKYKDDIFPFHEETRGKTINFIIQMDDAPGLLSSVLQTVARFHGNILTIHQSIPINGVATLTLSVEILPGEGNAEAMVETIEQSEGIHYLQILGRE